MVRVITAPRRGALRGVGVRGRDRAGVTLVLVLSLIVVLAAITSTTTALARSGTRAASNVRAAAVAAALAESGIVAAQAMIDDSLARHADDEGARHRFLLALSTDSASPLTLALGEGRVTVQVIDVTARFDVNRADEAQWLRFLRPFTADGNARALAAAIVARQRGEQASSRVASARDSLRAALLGRDDVVGDRRRAYERVDDLLYVPAMSLALFERIAPYLTVDGNGDLGRRAPQAVQAVAGGSLVDAPTRLLLRAHGQAPGSAIARTLDVVVDVARDGLRVVRTRESAE